MGPDFTNAPWTVGRIRIYPCKSLPGIDVSATELLPAGNLRHDREFALIDEDGRFMNAKRTAEIHRIDAQWELAARTVALSIIGTEDWKQFHLDADRDQLAAWFSDFFRTRLKFTENPNGGFPDDTEASGPTVVSTATWAAIANWFPGLDADEVRRRFRANIEIDGMEPFGEDRLYGLAGHLSPFRIGAATLMGSNPCQRCVVPTRDSRTGDAWSGFQKEFATHREATLPAWAEMSRFNHYYRLTVNTVVWNKEPQPICVGDPVSC